MSLFDIAIDPGSVGTGFAIFRDGRFAECGTIWPKGKDRLHRLESLKSLYTSFLTRLSEQGTVSRIAVEQWQKHLAGSKTHGMMLCSEARGLLICVSFGFTKGVSYVTKGTKPKSEAVMLGKARGCDGSEHAMDALHLGILAGFEKYF